MSANTIYLQKHGWTLTSTRKQGLFKIQRWYHPSFGGGHAQDHALMLQRSSLKYEKRLKVATKAVQAVYPNAHAWKGTEVELSSDEYVKACFAEDERVMVWNLQESTADNNRLLARGTSELNVWEKAAEAIKKEVTK